MTKCANTPGKRGLTGKTRKFDPTYYKIRPNQERVRYLFDYREDGELVRKNLCSPHSRGKIGEVPKGGVCTDGYKQIDVDGKRYLLHHLVWLWHMGFWSENQLDHINRNRRDCRIENLREVSPSCNMKNKGASKSNSTGVKGVHYREKDRTYSVSIRFGGAGGKLRYLGQYRCLIEAAAHRYAAETCLQWNDCDANSSAYQYLKQQGIIK